MAEYVVIDDIERVLNKVVLRPMAVAWNRLEGRPRQKEFTRALKAEVRDPLWMLTRQWQMGEFLGEDVGSPVAAKVAWTTDAVTELKRTGGSTEPYNPELPLEASIEARSVPWTRAGRPHNVGLRLVLGRRWKKLLVAAGHGDRIPDFENAYRFEVPDPNTEGDNAVTAHPAVWQTLRAIARRAVDGGALYLHLAQPGSSASDGLGLLEPARSEIDALGDEFVAWVESLYFQPDPNAEAWKPRHLEYELDLSAPRGEIPAALSAPEYRGGRLDWFHFDAVAPTRDDAPGRSKSLEVTSFLPSTMQFDGMPNTRHWTFEEGVTNFGEIQADKTDIPKMLLIEFGLVFANDWFLLPIDLPVGSLTEIRGLAVTNVFGERLWIEPAITSSGPTRSWQMFRLTDKGARDERLFLPATTPTGLESAPIESVSCVRDEVSNMVWGIETLVQLSDGSSRRGRELALELHAKYQNAVVPPTQPAETNDAKIRYVLMTSVAEHWIPFIPVHMPGDNREIQLQRAAMPRLLEGNEGVLPEKIAPRTWLLREGLDTEAKQSYYVAEEEVERAGTVVETKWQRCRWKHGRVVTWLGHQRKTGRGEGSSGLAFDTLMPKPRGTTS